MPLPSPLPGEHQTVVSLLTHVAPPLASFRGENLSRDLVPAIRSAGVVGMGGAGFPAADKLNAALNRAAGPRKPARLIINACDGEPDALKDTQLMRTNGSLVAAGAALVALASNANDVVFAAHHSDTGSAAVLQNYDLPWRTISVPERYVSSEAGALNSLADGGAARPGTKWQPLATLPRPILVFNAETLARIALAWQAHASGQRLYAPKLITVTGTARPGLFEVSDDVTFEELLAERTELDIDAVLLGGYGGTWLPWSQVAKLEVKNSALKPLGASLGAGLVRVIEANTCPVRVVNHLAQFLARENARQCGPCMFGLPSLVQDWLAMQDPEQARSAHSRFLKRLPMVQGRGACAHPDGVVKMLSSALRTFDPHLARPCAGCSPSGNSLAGSGSHVDRTIIESRQLRSGFLAPLPMEGSR